MHLFYLPLCSHRLEVNRRRIFANVNRVTVPCSRYVTACFFVVADGSYYDSGLWSCWNCWMLNAVLGYVGTHCIMWFWFIVCLKQEHKTPLLKPAWPAELWPTKWSLVFRSEHLSFLKAQRMTYWVCCRYSNAPTTNTLWIILSICFYSNTIEQIIIIDQYMIMRLWLKLSWERLLTDVGSTPVL